MKFYYYFDDNDCETECEVEDSRVYECAAKHILPLEFRTAENEKIAAIVIKEMANYMYDSTQFFTDMNIDEEFESEAYRAYKDGKAGLAALKSSY